MAHFWMDISRDDDGEVMSIVAGCDKCGTRTVTNDLKQAKNWITVNAEKQHSDREPRAVRQIGDPLRFSGNSYGDREWKSPSIPLALEIIAQGQASTQDIADALEAKYHSTYTLLRRLAKEGVIRKVKKGQNTFWEVLEAGSEAPEAEIAVAVALETVKPVERLLQPLYGNPAVLQGFSDNAEVYGRFGFKGHMGIDIGVVKQPVLAAHDGIVEFAGDGGEWPIMGAAAGNCILLKGQTLRTGYAHLEKSYVGIGEEVKAGDVIGISGDTGATTGYHLHFEVMPIPHDHHNGYAGRVDPTPYLYSPTSVEGAA